MRIIDVFFRLVSLFYNRSTINLITKIRRKLYISWLRSEIRHIGVKCHVDPFRKLEGAKYISIGDCCDIGYDCVIELYDNHLDNHYTPSLTFGNNSSLGDGGHISCINRIMIGNNVRMGRYVFITDNAHGASDPNLLDIPANKRPLFSKGEVILEDNVWIGEKVSIMPGVTIGRGTIVGANSVVTKSMPPYSLVAGNPARVIKDLSMGG